jgi:hypothetical protein
VRSFASAALHVGYMRRDLMRTLCRLLDVAGNLLRRRALLFHGCGDRRGYFRQLLDGPADFLDRADRLFGRCLDVDHLLTNIVGRLCGLIRCFDLGCNDGKATAGFAGARGFNGRIQGKQIGLTGNGIDQFDHITDPGRIEIDQASVTLSRPLRGPSFDLFFDDRDQFGQILDASCAMQ